MEKNKARKVKRIQGGESETAISSKVVRKCPITKQQGLKEEDTGKRAFQAEGTAQLRKVTSSH